MSKAQEGEESLPERWSAKAKSEVVLRLLRCESVDAVSREMQVAAHEVETWCRDFLDGGAAGLKKRSRDPDERALRQTQARVGESTMARTHPARSAPRFLVGFRRPTSLDAR